MLKATRLNFGSRLTNIEEDKAVDLQKNKYLIAGVNIYCTINSKDYSMENNGLFTTEETIQIAESPIQIYSKTAVLGFSIFFGPIFGGVLLFRNLRKIQKQEESNKFKILFIF